MVQLTRRRILATGASIIGFANLAETASALAEISPGSCDTKLSPTRGWVDVPEFKSGAPKRTSFLEPGVDGERLILTGRVLTTRCEPVAGATLQFWQTDPKGEYDYVGYKLRGFQRADKDGRYRLETIMPGYYNPIRHIHYMVGALIQGPSQAVLMNCSVEFPTDDENKNNPELPGRSGRVPLTAMTRENGVLLASYDIVLNL